MKLFIKVKPGSKESKIQKLGGSNLLVQVKARAEGGQANLELVKLLAEYFKVPRMKISIKSGATGRFKIIEIQS